MLLPAAFEGESRGLGEEGKSTLHNTCLCSERILIRFWYLKGAVTGFMAVDRRLFCISDSNSKAARIIFNLCRIKDLHVCLKKAFDLSLSVFFNFSTIFTPIIPLIFCEVLFRMHSLPISNTLFGPYERVIPSLSFAERAFYLYHQYK